jgi:hypothetical protein
MPCWWKRRAAIIAKLAGHDDHIATFDGQVLSQVGEHLARGRVIGPIEPVDREDPHEDAPQLP